MTIKVQDPGPKREPAADWPKVAKRVKRHPGKWVLVKEGASMGVAVALRTGKIAAMRDLPGLEITTRNNNRETKTCDVFVRITGDEN